jgi:hypothetical protein
MRFLDSGSASDYYARSQFIADDTPCYIPHQSGAGLPSLLLLKRGQEVSAHGGVLLHALLLFLAKFVTKQESAEAWTQSVFLIKTLHSFPSRYVLRIHNP